MNRKLIWALLVSGLAASSTGCSTTPKERDYAEYNHARDPSARGSGDKIGQFVYATSDSNGSVQVGASTQRKSSGARPTFSPSDVATIPHD